MTTTWRWGEDVDVDSEISSMARIAHDNRNAATVDRMISFELPDAMPNSSSTHSQNIATRSITRLFALLDSWAKSGWAGPVVAAWGVLQSSILPGPSDAVFLPLAVAEPKRAPVLGFWAGAGAVIGSMIAYTIGALAFSTIGVPLLALLGVGHTELADFQARFAAEGWILILLGSLPLFSSKLIGMVAGGLGYPIGIFLALTALVRGVRFPVTGLLIRMGGPYIDRWLRGKQRKLSVQETASETTSEPVSETSLSTEPTHLT